MAPTCSLESPSLYQEWKVELSCRWRRSPRPDSPLRPGAVWHRHSPKCNSNLPKSLNQLQYCDTTVRCDNDNISFCSKQYFQQTYMIFVFKFRKWKPIYKNDFTVFRCECAISIVYASMTMLGCGKTSKEKTFVGLPLRQPEASQLVGLQIFLLWVFGSNQCYR